MKQLWYTLAMVHRCDPKSFWIKVLCVVVESVLPLVGLRLLQGLVDAVSMAFTSDAAGAPYMPWLLAMVLVMLLNRVASATERVVSDVLGQRLIDHMGDLLQHQAARLDMGYYDSASYHDTLHRAGQEAGTRPLTVVNQMLAVAGSLLSAAVVIVMLATARWEVVVVMVLAVVPSFVVRLRKAKGVYDFRRNNTQLYRRTAYYSYLLTSREGAQEVRTYRLVETLRGRYVQARAQLAKALLRISRRMGMYDVASAVVEAIAMGLAVWLLADKTLAGALTVGTFVMLFEAFRRGQTYLNTLTTSVAGLYDARLFINNLFEFLNLQPTIETPSTPDPMPERATEIEFRDVTFVYPNTERKVLDHYSLKARVGEVTRIDGENGYGKSTLVKLLLRFYDPQEGQILIDGTDIRRFDPAELRSRMGVLFQDFVRFNCTLGENISMGDIDHWEADVETAARLSGADQVANKLGKGYATQLGRMFDGGEEPSMGQWQRIALARALQSNAPILLLDEPMAWIDERGRKQIQETIEKLKKDKIIILITHA